MAGRSLLKLLLKKDSNGIVGLKTQAFGWSNNKENGSYQLKMYNGEFYPEEVKRQI